LDTTQFFYSIIRGTTSDKYYCNQHATEQAPNPSNMKIIAVLLLVPSIFAFTPSHNVARSNNKFLSFSSTAIFSVADVKAPFKQNPQKTFLLDVREPDEWAEAHLSLATSMPLSKLTIFPIDRFTYVSIVLNTNIFVHCRRGRRAKQAVKLLQ
jgi:rhodanese-related sulfurtransferase